MSAVSILLLALYILLVESSHVKAAESKQDVLYKNLNDKRLDRIEDLLVEYIKHIRDLQNTVNIQNGEIQRLKEEVNLLKISNRKCEKQKGEMFNTNETESELKASSEKKKEKRLLVGSTPPPLTKRTTSFYAYMKTHDYNPGIHHTFIFDVVKVNINGGYSPYSGVFSAPEEGVYVFTYSLRAKCNSYGAYEIVKNASVENVVIFSDTGVCMEDHATGTIVLILDQSDVVLVRTHSTLSHTGVILSDVNGYSYFAGWLISK